MTKNKYIASGISVEEDQERLSYFEETWDPVTIRRIHSLGITSGWKCLDIGAGYGSITTWLGEQVAPNGKVVATDIRPELHRSVNPIIEIRKNDILKDELEKNYYDLVHCRSLLQHLSDPDSALSNMADAVKPGGWLIIEEFDNWTIPVSDSRNPSADFVYRYINSFRDMQAKHTGVDYEFGRNIHSVLMKTGFDDIFSEGTTLICHGGDPWLKSLLMTYRAAFNLTVDALSPDDRKRSVEGMELLSEYYNDPTFSMITQPLFGAWGKKPK